MDAPGPPGLACLFPMRFPRWLKYTLVGFATFVAVAAIALVVVVHTIDLDRYARLAIAEVKTLTGRELSIAASWKSASSRDSPCGPRTSRSQTPRGARAPR